MARDEAARIAALRAARRALAGALSLCAGVAAAQSTDLGGAPARADAAMPGYDAEVRRSLKCPHPANPHLRHFECKTTPFDAVDETLTGDWKEARADLKRHGITPTASYQAGWFGAGSGPGTAPTFAGQLTGSLNVELDKAVGAWKGLSFYVLGIAAAQTNVESWLNTNLFAVNYLGVGNSGWLGEMYLQQTMPGGALTVAAGWMGPTLTFASLPVFANYLSTAFGGNPVAPLTNDPAFGPTPPNSQWGAQATWNLAPAWQLAGGVFNNNPNAANGAKHGTNFRMRQGNTGALWIGQVNYLHNQAPGDTGMPGQYTVGVFHDGNDFRDLATGTHVSGNWNAYAMAQQQVVREGSGSAQGITLWGAVNYAAKQNVNILPVEVGLGASWQGPLRGRPDDVASAGWFYGSVSDTQAGATATQAIELNYQWALTRAITLIGDFQYLWRLNGLPSPGSAVFGVQANVTF